MDTPYVLTNKDSINGNNISRSTINCLGKNLDRIVDILQNKRLKFALNVRSGCCCEVILRGEWYELKCIAVYAGENQEFIVNL